MLVLGALRHCLLHLSLALSGQVAWLQDEKRWLETHLPDDLFQILRPVLLAFDVVQAKGQEPNALAREPEEIHRAVQEVLQWVDKETRRPEGG